MPGVQLAHLTWEEAAEAIRRYPIAVLPVGAGTNKFLILVVAWGD